MTVAASWATRVADFSFANQRPTLPATSSCCSLTSTTSRDRKFSWTNSPRLSPIWSFLRSMIAVWGIFRPMGWRNRAVTANQSANAPTIPPSAAARTYSNHGYRCCSAKATAKMTAMMTSSPVASRFM